MKYYINEYSIYNNNNNNNNNNEINICVILYFLKSLVEFVNEQRRTISIFKLGNLVNMDQFWIKMHAKFFHNL